MGIGIVVIMAAIITNIVPTIAKKVDIGEQLTLYYHILPGQLLPNEWWSAPVLLHRIYFLRNCQL
ncbi:MAG: hypothetical protein AB8W37_01765 [Arsenophonus endosymbiont of Dermacentor nuttalli]